MTPFTWWEANGIRPPGTSFRFGKKINPREKGPALQGEAPQVFPNNL